jgi:hypothetical protein
LADEGFEGVVQAVDPFLDVGLAVISPGEDVGDPDGDEPAVGEAQVEGMWREMAVEDLGQAESDQEGQQQGDVVDRFVGEFQGGTPTRAGRKASLYRRGRPGRKIQAKEREHGHAAQDGPRYNCRFSEHLIRESRVLRHSLLHNSRIVQGDRALELGDLSGTKARCLLVLDTVRWGAFTRRVVVTGAGRLRGDDRANSRSAPMSRNVGVLDRPARRRGRHRLRTEHELRTRSRIRQNGAMFRRCPPLIELEGVRIVPRR